MKQWMYMIAIVLVGLYAFTVRAQDVDNENDTDVQQPVIPPVLKAEVPAEYPPRALEDRVESEVILEIDIDETGMVEGVQVVTPAEPEGYGFDDAAVNAANLFEFEPATQGGMPIPVRITYRTVFALADEPLIADTDTAENDIPAAEEPNDGSAIPAKRVLNFNGTLKERGTRFPLAGVTVTIFRGEGNVAVGYEAVTDADGAFGFYNLAPGKWMLLAEPEGYFPLRTSDEVVKNERTEASYYVERSDYNPYDVVVEGERIRKEVSRTTLQIEEVERIPGTFGDVLTVVKNLPGVARTGAAAGNIVVRGSSPEDTQVFVDGVEVPIIYHFGGLRSVIPLGMLDRLDFYPGNFTAEFGRATGGVVDVRLKRLKPEKFGGYVDVNLADSGIYLETPLGEKSAVAAAFRRSYIDGIINAVVPDSASVNLITAPRYYDYQLLGTFRPNDNHELSAFFFGSDDELKLLFENPADFSPDLTATSGSTSTSFYRTVLEHRYMPSRHFENVFKTSAGRNKVYVGLGDQIFLDLNTYVAQIYDKFTVSLSDNVKIAGGIDYLYSTADARIKFPEVAKEGEPGGRPDLSTIQYTESTDQVSNSLGTFLQLESKLFDRWTVIPGVRYDYFSRVDTSSLAPRFNTRFALAEKWTVKGGVGVYHQEPSFDETDEVFGNPDLGLEKAMHYSVGFEYSPLDYLTLDVTGFYKDMSDLVSRTDATVNVNGELQRLNYVNGGQGRVYGLEVMLKHNFANNFNGWISYTLSKALRKDVGDTEWRRFDFDQTHILTLLGSYSLPKNWTLGFRWRVVTGSPDTPREGAVYSVDKGYYEPVYGRPNSDRLPTFHQADVRLDKRWVFDAWMLTAYLDVQNIYNSPNVTGYQYNYDSTERRARQGLPILPVIGVKGEF
ncbi:MAG: TonB-dependent receptor [Deltaproteobacteria bacterium]|nr:TonB-dependent receptor [Deltaproteobacteria bacterium]MBN2670361.1 TonB-dependent receptor [Deltaproteobacteria bacterium]